MSLPLYLDENVPRSIAVGLRRRGVDVLTVLEDQRTGWPDDQIVDRATELGRLLFSQDEDMLVEGQRRQAEGRRFSGIVYAHQLSVTIGACVRDLELIAKAANREETVNRVEFLPL